MTHQTWSAASTMARPSDDVQLLEATDWMTYCAFHNDRARCWTAEASTQPHDAGSD